jgi:hypothetical protein
MTQHQDAFASETRYAKREQVSEFSTFNSEATDDVVISHPGSGRRELELQKPLLVAMARQNKFVCDSAESVNDRDAGAVFDEALCDVTELALQSVSFGESQVPLHKLRALVIRVARNLGSFAALTDHIARYSAEEIERFGLQSAYGESTYTKAAKELKDAGQLELVREAAFVAVYALFRNGVPIPASVKDRYALAKDVGPAASNFSDGARKLALYNLVEDLLGIVVEQLDLQRNVNQSCDLRSLLGVFAYTAHHGESIESYEQTASHSHNLDSAFSGPSIRGHTENMKLRRVEEMFDEINQALLEYILESGVVSKPVMISYDLTDIQSLGIAEYDETFLTEDGRWRFASLTFTDSDLEFSFGLRLLKSEAQRARVLKTFLRNLTSMVDVKLFMADRGFDGKEDIEACQAYIPGRWVICAQDDSHPYSQNSDYEQLRTALDPGGTAVIPRAGYDNLNQPVKIIGHSGADKDADTPNPIRAFYTRITLPTDEEDREELITTINFRYNQRGKIEPMFRMAKNRFDVSTDTDDPVRKAFYFHISVLFYNLYKIVNTVPSPKHGLELDITQNELLEVIENLALNGPTPPHALTYHREHN